MSEVTEVNPSNLVLRKGDLICIVTRVSPALALALWAFPIGMANCTHLISIRSLGRISGGSSYPVFPQPIPRTPEINTPNIDCPRDPELMIPQGSCPALFTVVAAWDGVRGWPRRQVTAQPAAPALLPRCQMVLLRVLPRSAGAGMYKLEAAFFSDSRDKLEEWKVFEGGDGTRWSGLQAASSNGMVRRKGAFRWWGPRCLSGLC